MGGGGGAKERDREQQCPYHSEQIICNIHKHVEGHSRQTPVEHPTVLVKLAVFSITGEQKDNSYYTKSCNSYSLNLLRDLHK